MAQQLPSMPSNFKVQEQAKTKQPWHKLKSRGKKKEERERYQNTNSGAKQSKNTKNNRKQKTNPKHLQITIYA
jgi:hypothetical protein